MDYSHALVNTLFLNMIFLVFLIMVDFVLFEMYAFDKHLFLRYNVLFLLVCVFFFNVETVYHSFKNIF